MTMRMSAILVFFALSVALTNLGAADRTNEIPANASAPLTRSDQSEHPLPDGEGRNVPIRLSLPDVHDDAWHANFNERLDESIARLQEGDERKKAGALTVTWGTRSGNPSEAPFAASAVGSEQEDQTAMVARLLQEHGLPPGLTSVVAVESAFNPLALSPKGARGLWQLMPDTARRYGLRVEREDDERTNPFKSTHAAAAYMKDLFAQFQDWPLALAAYNAGEDRVARALTRTGARDFWTLSRHRALPEETMQYVPAVLEKLEGPLDAPETEPSISPAGPSQNESSVGRIAYATPAINGD